MSMRRSRIRVRPNVGLRSTPATPSGKAEESNVAGKATENTPSAEVVEAPVVTAAVEKVPNVTPSPDNVETDTTVAPVKASPCENEPATLEETKDSEKESSSEVKTNHSTVKPSTTGRRSRIKPQVKLPLGKSPTVKASPRPSTDKPITSSGKESDASAKAAEDAADESRLKVPVSDTSRTENNLSKSKDTFDSQVAPNIQSGSKKLTEITPETSSKKSQENASESEKSTLTLSPVKPTIKRGWLPKAKPNVIGAERRRSRLTSVSDQEEIPSAKKQKTVNISTSSSQSAGATDTSTPASTVTSEKQTSKETSETQKPPKTKRRASQKLDSLVSENRNKLTIGDLIYMNPTTNLMKRYKTGNSDQNAQTPVTNTVSRSSTPSIDDNMSVRSDPPDDANSVVVEEEEDTENMMAPRVMIGPDGSIVVDDKSLLVKNPAHQVDTSIVEGAVLVENDNYNPAFYYKRRNRGKPWESKETVKFYLALSAVGTDFSLMTTLFKKRSRLDLKKKFKMEEKKHKDLVDRALAERPDIDLSIFETWSEDEKEAEEKKASKTKTNKKKGIREAVNEELEKEGTPAAKSKKTRQRTRKPKAEKPKSEKPKPEKASKPKKTKSEKPQKKKKPNKRTAMTSRSRYYDESDHSSEEMDHSERENQEKEIVTEENDDVPSGDDNPVERFVPKVTRSGRLPKETRRFDEEMYEGKKRRESLSDRGNFGPLMNITPGVVPEGGVIEDQESGQRLLLVKSPPPVGTPGRKDSSNEFVHVYLLSPSVSRKAETEMKSPENTLQVRSPASSSDIKTNPGYRCQIVGKEIYSPKMPLDSASMQSPTVKNQVTSHSDTDTCRPSVEQSPMSAFSPPPRSGTSADMPQSPHSVPLASGLTSPVLTPRTPLSVGSPPYVSVGGTPVTPPTNVSSPSQAHRVKSLPDTPQVICATPEHNDSKSEVVLEFDPSSPSFSQAGPGGSSIQTLDSSQVTTFMTDDGEVLEILIDPSFLNLDSDSSVDKS